MGVIEAEVEELPGGVEPVARFGVIDLALHDIDEEPDYKAAVVGLLADDVGEEWSMGVSIVLGFCGEHMFYSYRVKAVGVNGGLTGRGMGVRSLRVAKGAEPLLTPCLRDLADNVSGDGFARVDRWPAPWVPAKGDQWIHEAFVHAVMPYCQATADRRFGTVERPIPMKAGKAP